MRILYDNLISSAAISAFSENPYYLFSVALPDSRLSRIGKTVGCAGEWVKFSFPAPVSASYFSVISHNFTAAATVKLEANTTDTWTTPAFSRTLTLREFARKPDCICVEFAEQTYQYWRLTVADAANPDGYIRIAYIYLGKFLQMPGAIPGGANSRQSESSFSTSSAGQLYGYQRYQYKTVKFTFSNVIDSVMQSVDAFFAAVDVVRPFILLCWENSLDVQPPVYVSLMKLPETAYESGDGVLYNFTLEFRERF